MVIMASYQLVLFKGNEYTYKGGNSVKKKGFCLLCQRGPMVNGKNFSPEEIILSCRREVLGKTNRKLMGIPS